MNNTHRTLGILGLWSGVGIVVANMVGAGVFLGTGFMAQELAPGWILIAWIVGALLAIAGARTYAEASFLIPRSGGEYRYLSELIHPAVGYLAGWASLLIGFSAPIAISASGAAAFAISVFEIGDPRWGGTLIIVALVVFHSIGLHVSKWTQNSLVIGKSFLVLAFVGLGLVAGNNSWPSWVPITGKTSFDAAAFATSLFFVSYAFTGWNAVSYASEEFRNPRDVPRAMLIGCSIVGIVYLFVNWILVANLTPEKARVVFEFEQNRITLGHVVAQDIIGRTGSNIMSLGIAVVMVSSSSAMLLVGPRVCAEMAHDGYLPGSLRGKAGEPPRGSILVQGGLAIFLLHMHSMGQLLNNAAGILIFFSALVAAGLFFAGHRVPQLPKPRVQGLWAAGVYLACAVWMLYNAFVQQTGLLIWLGAVGTIGLVAYLFTSSGNKTREQL